MKQLSFKKQTPNGLIDGVLRVHERFIFFKYKDSQVAKQTMNQFREKGINIEEGKGWIKVDLLNNQELVKLGDYEIDTNESNEIIEEKLFNFYTSQYKKLGFYIDTQ